MKDKGFQQAQSDNLPRIDSFMMTSFFGEKPDFISAETKSAKAGRCVMSMKKLAILSAGHKYGVLNGTDMHTPTPGLPPAPVHGMNVMLGGAMLSGIILVILLYCYCCHKTQRKLPSNVPQYWRDPGLSMEIYTVESQNCYHDEFTTPEIHRPPTPGPPPAYDTVVPNDKDPLKEKQPDDTGLPSYDSAVRLEVAGNGYV